MIQTRHGILLTICTMAFASPASACKVEPIHPPLAQIFSKDLSRTLKKKPHALVIEAEVTDSQWNRGSTATVNAHVRSVLQGHFSGQAVTVEYSIVTSCDRAPRIGDTGIIGGWLTKSHTGEMRLITPTLSDFIDE